MFDRRYIHSFHNTRKEWPNYKETTKRCFSFYIVHNVCKTSTFYKHHTMVLACLFFTFYGAVVHFNNPATTLPIPRTTEWELHVAFKLFSCIKTDKQESHDSKTSFYQTLTKEYMRFISKNCTVYRIDAVIFAFVPFLLRNICRRILYLSIAASKLSFRKYPYAYIS